MRGYIAATIFCACFLLAGASPATAQATGGPDDVRVCGATGCRYVSPTAAKTKGVPQARHFGVYTKKPKSARKAAKKRKTKAAKTRSVPTRDRSVFTYALNPKGDVTGFNSASASCLPGSIKAKLGEVARRYGKVTIISALRRGARVAGSGSPSYHASCRAVDFKVARNQAAAARWLKQTHQGGVGTYTCAMHHIHIDNGRRARWHHCVNKSGRPIRKRS